MKNIYKLVRIREKISILITLLLLFEAYPVFASEIIKTNCTNISAVEAMHIMNTFQNVIILDVRKYEEYESGHLTGSLSVPFSKLKESVDRINKDMTIIVYSYDGEIGALACEELKKSGFRSLYNLSDGVMGWRDAGYPLVVTDDIMYFGRPVPEDTLTLKSLKSTNPDYCPSYGGSTRWEYIQNVSYSELSEGVLSITVDIFIANPTGCAYGEPCPVYDNSPEYVNAWIDFNGDKVFDENEKVLSAALRGYMGINYAGTMSTSTIVTIPEDAVDKTWMRVNLGWGFNPDDPCLLSWAYGDVVDVFIELTPPDPPEVKDINIIGIPNENIPLTNDISSRTQEKVKFEAVLENTDGYEITDVKWSGDITEGEGNPYEYVPPSGSHGNKNVICNVFYKHNITGEQGTVNFSKSFKLFFYKFGDDDGSGEPNWFKYWKRDGAVPDMENVKYKADLSGFGQATWRNRVGQAYIGPKAAGQHYSRPVVIDSTFFEQPESFGGPTVRGIDCAAAVVAHENYHIWVWEQWEEGGSFHGMTDSDRGLGADDWNDQLPDFYETATSRTRNDSVDTYNLERVKHPTYRTYGDNEYMAMRAGKAARGIKEQDWAYPGKQSEPAYKKKSDEAVEPYTPVDALFTGEYTDEGVDVNDDGFYEFLRVNPEVDVTAGGEFNIVAYLYDITSNEVTLFNEALDLESGIYSVSIDFDGLSIREHGVDGPFTVTFIMTNEFGDSIDYQYDAHTTAAYSHDDFMQRQAYFLNQYSDYGLSVNGDVLYDSLVIEIGVGVKSDGDYVIEGGLYGNDEDAIELKERNLQLNEGNSTVTLAFDGLKINKKRIDGPYHLRYLGIRGTETGDYIYEAYSTSTYSYNDFVSPQARFSGEFTDYGTDVDGDTRFDYLIIEIGVETAVPGDYSLIGHLYDLNNDLVITAKLQRSLATGVNQVEMEFDGISIYKHSVDGPYILKHLSLLDSDGKVMELIDNADTTAAYLFTDFQKPPLPLFQLSGKFADYLTDIDLNCIYDFLSIETQVNLSDSGYVIIKAKLEDINGDEIVWAEKIEYLKSDTTQIVRLDFDGLAIYNHGVNGPYSLKNVYGYHTGDPSKPDYIEDAFTTRPYSHTTFNTIPGVIMELSESICEGENIKIGDKEFMETGIYSVEMINQFGCDSIVNLNLTVNQNPIISFGNDTTIYSTETLLLDAGEGYVYYEWSTGETTQTVLIDSLVGIGEHTYSVLVVDNNNCIGSDTIIITIKTVTSVLSIPESIGKIKLFPNPTSGTLNISIENIQNKTEITIYSETGQTVFSKQFVSVDNRINEVIDLSGYSSGIYIVKVINNNRIKTERFILIK